MMDTHLVQLSVVVVGQVHNPTILNPDFLAIRKIVPKEWGWELIETVTTPPLSVVRYANGVTIKVDHNKLQVADVRPEPDPASSKVGEIAKQYVSTLPHVRYSAVGVNFHSVIEMDNAELYLKNRFLKKGNWDSSQHPLKAVGLRLLYPLPDGPEGRLLLSLDAGRAERVSEQGEQGPKSVAIANGNVHWECTDYPADRAVAEYIDRIGDSYELYSKLLANTL